jgi:putative Ca2+/H+ antiporter (TMEM165/GDT1 family)
MDLRILASTFVAVFLAELGDKTQIAVLTLGAGTKSRSSIFLGASLALVTSSLIAVFVADQVARHLNPRWTQGIAGVMLAAVGVLYCVSALRSTGP